MSTGKIYKIVNDINLKIYIGKTIKSLDARFREHLVAARRWAKETEEGKPHPYESRLYPSMNLHGYNNFHIELVEDNVEDLESREQYWIAYLNTTNADIGYNISPGGLGGPLFKGHKHSEEMKANCSKRFKGKKQTKELVQARSRGRARRMQSLLTGEIYSILDLPKGYFYQQDFIDYRIYKSNNIFYACLESPHNLRASLDEETRLLLLSKLQAEFANRATHSIAAYTTWRETHKNDEEWNKKRIDSCKKSGQKRRIAHWETFILDNNIDIELYKEIHHKFKNNCPNKTLCEKFNISYSQVRGLNEYLGLYTWKKDE